MVRNHEVHCNPIPAADVPGFRFTRNQNGVIVARCVWCRIGFVVREETAERARYAMGVHLQYAHGETPSRAAGWWQVADGRCRWIAEAGAIDTLVKALRADEPVWWPIEAIEQIIEADTFRVSVLSPAMTSIS